MTSRRNSVIHQPTLPGMPVDPLLAWLEMIRAMRKPADRKQRKSAREKRLEAARRDPRQISMLGPGHYEELTGW